MRGTPSVQVADDETDVNSKSDIDLLHEIGSRIAAADPLHAVLSRVVDFVSTIVQCDSCFVYVLDDDDLVLRASKTPHPDVVDRLKLRVGQGITGWVAEHRTRCPLHRRGGTYSRIRRGCPRRRSVTPAPAAETRIAGHLRFPCGSGRAARLRVRGRRVDVVLRRLWLCGSHAELGSHAAGGWHLHRTWRVSVAARSCGCDCCRLVGPSRPRRFRESPGLALVRKWKRVVAERDHRPPLGQPGVKVM